MVKNIKGKREFINNLVKDLGSVKLSSACGKYSDLVDNGDEIVVISFAGKYGYNTTPVSKLGTKAINTIYNDLREDFDD